MPYDELQVERHTKAGQLIDRIIDDCFSMASEGKVDEKKIWNFISSEFRRENLVHDNHLSIVAFNENSALPHYRQDNNLRLKEGTLILIDSWARLREKNSPYADITRIAYYGQKIPKDIKDNFSLILKARDSAISFMQEKVSKGIMPYGKEVDFVARNIISEAGFGENFIHGTGHSLDIRFVHGPIRLGRKSKKKVQANMLYAVEPGIYFKGSYGMRSEVDVLVAQGEVNVTTSLPKKIVLLKP